MLGESNSTGNTTNETCESYQESPSLVDEPRASEIFRIVALTFLVLFSIVGNGLVLRGAIHRRNRPFVYYLVINLSIAEIIPSVARCFVMFEITTPFNWVFGKFMCQFVHSTGDMVAPLVQSFTLAAIAIFRAVVMMKPKRNRPSKRFAAIIMAISWILGTCFAIPYGRSLTVESYKDPCIPDKYLRRCRGVTFKGRRIFDILYFTAFFFIPFVLMLASYGIVIYKIKQHIQCEAGARKESLELTSVTTTRGSSIEIEGRTAQFLAAKHQFLPNNPKCPSVGHGLSRDKEHSSSKICKLEKDVLNLLYILILIFFICYLPWIIMYILSHIAQVQFAKGWPYMHIFRWYMFLLYALPSALHPICYGAASKVIDINFSKYFRLPCNKDK